MVFIVRVPSNPPLILPWFESFSSGILIVRDETYLLREFQKSQILLQIEKHLESVIQWQFVLSQGQICDWKISPGLKLHISISPGHSFCVKIPTDRFKNKPG